MFLALKKGLNVKKRWNHGTWKLSKDREGGSALLEIFASIMESYFFLNWKSIFGACLFELYIYLLLFVSEGCRTNERKWKCKRTKSWTIRKASKIFRLLITSIKLDRTLFPGWVDDHFDQVAIRHLALFVVLIATDAFVPSCCRQRKQHPRISSVWLRLVSIWRDKQRV